MGKCTGSARAVGAFRGHAARYAHAAAHVGQRVRLAVVRAPDRPDKNRGGSSIPIPMVKNIMEEYLTR